MSESADPAGPVDCRVSRQTVVSYGAGTNSTAMVAEMVRRGEPIAAVVFADTGGERAETYAHVIEFSEWLTARGYPAITTVRQTTKVGDVAVMTLEAECLQARRLPGIAYGFGSCSEKWKQRPFRAWLKQTGWQDVTVCIGFDADEPHRAERGDQHDSGYAKRYPLIDWDMGRDECIAAIDAAGLKRPGKSACFYCPSSKAHEILALPAALQERALAMEDSLNEAAGEPGLHRAMRPCPATPPKSLTAREKARAGLPAKRPPRPWCYAARIWRNDGTDTRTDWRCADSDSREGGC